jgi:superfamily II DNA or RNA helicase
MFRADPDAIPQGKTPSPTFGAAGQASADASALRTASFVPCLHLAQETFDVVAAAAGESPERTLAVATLSFSYDGRRIPSATRFGGPGDPPGRNAPLERQARYLLETWGAVEVDCLDDVSARPGSRADYVLRPDENVHALCSFTAYAVPQLRAVGWNVTLGEDYPFRVVPPEAPWYAHVEADADGPGRGSWFNLELGVELGGTRVNLMPVLLDFLERLPPATPLDRLSAPGGRSFALALADGRHVMVPAERLRLCLKVLAELYRDPKSRARLRFHAAKADFFVTLERAFAAPTGLSAETAAPAPPPLAWTGDTRLAARARSFARPPSSAPPAPRGLAAELRPYQQEGVQWLQHLTSHDAGGILADDMGLGKTLQTIAHLVALKEAGMLDQPALVLAPTSVAGNWERELARFAPGLRVTRIRGTNRRAQWARGTQADVVVATYPLVVRDEPLLAKRTFSLVVLDEAQAIKNPRSATHRAVATLNVRWRLCLSGTPVENNLTELWALFSFLNPGLLGDEEWFRHRYAWPIERSQDRERLAALREQVAPYILRRTKEEVAKDLPPKTEMVLPVELEGAQRELYESLRLGAHREIRQLLSDKALGACALPILDALMKLRQVCCDPRLLGSEVAREVTESAKFAFFLELVEGQLREGRRLLVFSQFASMLRLMQRGLSERGIRWLELTGATTDRQKPVDAFQRGDADVFLITLKAGGTGLNLTSADTVIHYDPWWNPAAQAQASDRAYRIGQTKPVFVYNLIVAGSVEERMLALQQRKRALANGVLGVAAPSFGALSRDDVDDLFAPLGGADANEAAPAAEDEP